MRLAHGVIIKRLAYMVQTLGLVVAEILEQMVCRLPRSQTSAKPRYDIIARVALLSELSSESEG